MKMNNPVRFITILLIFLRSLTPGYSQGIKEIVRKLDIYLQNNPEEKIYLQTDGSAYNPGDQIFFKALLFNDGDNNSKQPADDLFIRLIDIDGLEIARTDHEIRDTNLSGELVIPKYIQDGEYMLIAYTDRMEDMFPDRAFFRQISIKDETANVLNIDISLQDTVCVSKGRTKVSLRFTDKNNIPVQASYSYELAGSKGKGKGDSDGKAEFELALPELTSAENLKLIVKASFKGADAESGMVIPTNDNYLDVAFYPEGGRLLYGVDSKIAFRSFNIVNRPVHFEGEIFDSENRSIIIINDNYLGIGIFNLKPEDGKSYYLKITRPSTISKTFALPIPESSGMTLAVDKNTADTLTLTIKHAGSIASGYSYILHNRGKVYRAGSIDTSGKTFKVPVSDLPSGVAEIAVFDPYLNLASKRLVYIDNGRGLKIKITATDLKDAPSGNSHFTIETTDGKGNPVAAGLTVSAVIGKYQPDLPGNYSIYSWLNLRSNIIGYLPTPGYFLDPSSKEILDYLLIANVNSRFTWHDVMRGEEDKVFRGNTKGEDINGTVAYVNGVYKLAARELAYSIMSPGSAYTISDRNKRAERDRKNTSGSTLYDGSTDIFSMINQIEPFRLVNDKIVFIKSGPNTISNQGGATIVINGTLSGENTAVLNSISTNDIERINVSTNFMDIQKYTGFNTMGVIEIYTKSGHRTEGVNKSTDYSEATRTDLSHGNNSKTPDLSKTLFWDPEVQTDSTGKAIISINNGHDPFSVVITVEGLTNSGLSGVSIMEYKNQ